VLLSAFALEASVADSAHLLSFDGIDERIIAFEIFPHLIGDEVAPFPFDLRACEETFGVACEVCDQLEVITQ
jgi:hypothetical protein